jgi:SAM-dependent methyltransferase
VTATGDTSPWGTFLTKTGGTLSNDGFTDYLQHFMDLCHERAFDTVLDLGAGSGQVSVPLVKAGFRVRCVDGHADSLHRLQEALDASHRRLVDIDCTDFESLRLATDSVDAVVAVRSLNHGWFNDVLMRFKRVCESLRPGGILLLYIAADDDFRKDLGKRIDPWTTVLSDGPEDGIPHVFPSRAELSSWLPGLRILQAKRYQIDVPRPSPYFHTYSRRSRYRMRRGSMVSSHHVVLAERPRAT